MMTDAWQRLRATSVGRWPGWLRALTVLLALIVLPVITVVAITPIKNRLSLTVGSWRSEQADFVRLEDEHHQLQARLTEARRRRLYLETLLPVESGRHPRTTHDGSVDTPDITHYMNVLERLALLNGWRQLTIGYRAASEDAASGAALELSASLSVPSLPGWWSDLYASGNLFGIEALALEWSGTHGAYNLRMTVLPRIAGFLPSLPGCADRCSVTEAVLPARQKGFLLRTETGVHQLKQLASDSSGRVSAAPHVLYSGEKNDKSISGSE